MNIVTIDPSLSCTAMIVNDKKFVYTKTSVSRTKKLSLKSWFVLVSDYATIHEYDDISDFDYSELEVEKYKLFNQITEDLIMDLIGAINPLEPTKIYIEGYSFSSDAGPLIDLSTFRNFNTP